MSAVRQWSKSSEENWQLGSAERIKLIDANDQLVDCMTLPAGYMEGAPVRAVVAFGRKFVEGGRRDSFYGKGEFAEVKRDEHTS